jgi:sedoheptulokinase
MTVVLGVDIGTSKVAAVVLDSESGELLASANQGTNAELSLEPPFIEQDSSLILNCAGECILDLPLGIRSKVQTIGVTGQMHGMLLWKRGEAQPGNLVTWQDGRCLLDGFLDSLQSRTDDNQIKSGYGCATLAWLAELSPEFLSEQSQAATIHDYFVARICGLDKALTDPSNAASWGFFDLVKQEWDLLKIRKSGIDEKWLPRVQPCGSRAGYLQRNFSSQWQIQEGVPVVVAIGDNQASLLATLQNPDQDVALTLGTGGQLSVAVRDILPYLSDCSQTVEFRPFLNDSYIAVCASLCGGRAFQWLVDVVCSWYSELGLDLPDKNIIYKKLDAMALNCDGSPLDVCSSFLGERHNSSLKGSIRSVDLSNFSLQNLSAAVMVSILRNLKDMMPAELLSSRKRIIGSGNGIRRLKAMHKFAEEIFDMPVIVNEESEEAALGAALLAAGSYG